MALWNQNEAVARAQPFVRFREHTLVWNLARTLPLAVLDLAFVIIELVDCTDFVHRPQQRRVDAVDELG